MPKGQILNAVASESESKNAAAREVGKRRLLSSFVLVAVGLCFFQVLLPSVKIFV